jgi:CDP-paratose 2-epimerase
VALLGKKVQTTYVDKARAGDHICYISDLTKFKSHYPSWRIRCSLDQILDKMLQGQSRGQPKQASAPTR